MKNTQQGLALGFRRQLVELGHGIHGLLIDAQDHVTGFEILGRGTARGCPLRRISSVTGDPGLVLATIASNSAEPFTVLPSNLRMTSPAFRPALSAGPPLVTSSTRAPAVSGTLNCCANSGVTGPIETPR